MKVRGKTLSDLDGIAAEEEDEEVLTPAAKKKLAKAKAGAGRRRS